jgi:hypothetical protein
MEKRDKMALLGSVLLLIAILGAGAYGLSRAYQYGQAPARNDGSFGQ